MAPTEGRVARPERRWGCSRGILCSKKELGYFKPQQSVYCKHHSTEWWIPLPSQFFPGCHPRVGLIFAEVPAGYLLWWWCAAELHLLNNMYTLQQHLTMHINWRDNSSMAANMLHVHDHLSVFSLAHWVFRSRLKINLFRKSFPP